MKRLYVVMAILLLSAVAADAYIPSVEFDDSEYVSARVYPGSIRLDSGGGLRDGAGNLRDEPTSDIRGGSLKGEPSSDIFAYTWDDTAAESLDLSLSQDLAYGDFVLSDYQLSESVGEAAAMLNLSLAAIYARYLAPAAYVPLRDPLWLVAIGSVEYAYLENDPDVFFSFPVDLSVAEGNPNYLLEYDWHEVERIGGTEAVLRRDGSSIGMLQITSGFGTLTDPIIPEEFGLIGAGGERRTDCWLALSDSGESFSWKPGVEGDRWSPADNANIVYAVYNETLRRSPMSAELSGKYEQAAILMWAHNRGTGIIGDSYYIQHSKVLAEYVPEIQTYVDAVKPARFTREPGLKELYSRIAFEATGGDEYPVMALISYVITENRYAGRW